MSKSPRPAFRTSSRGFKVAPRSAIPVPVVVRDATPQVFAPAPIFAVSSAATLADLADGPAWGEVCPTHWVTRSLAGVCSACE